MKNLLKLFIPFILFSTTTFAQNGEKNFIDPQNTKEKEFVQCLESGTKLAVFFSNNWTLIYHEDNRCDGSTDGQIDNLAGSQIDMVIKLQVKNNGDGWACDKKEPRSYELDFNLKELVSNWDRYEIPNYENHEKNITYVVGGGESDYLTLYFDDNQLIVKMEYRSEDPG